MTHKHNSDLPDQQMDTEDWSSKSGYSQQLIRLVTQETRYSLILNILAHPDRAPSLKELNYMKPDKGRTTIVNHLDKLVESGIVHKLVIPEGERERSLPHTFYTISEDGYKFLKFHGLVPLSEEEMRHDYLRVQKSEQVERYEEAPRDEAVVSREDTDAEKAEKLRRLVDIYYSEERRSQSSQGAFDTVSGIVTLLGEKALAAAGLVRDTSASSEHLPLNDSDSKQDDRQKLRP